MAAMFCQSCGAQGEPKKFTPGSIAIEIVLWLFFIIPGLIYSIWRLTARYSGCSSCGSKNIIPITSPMAQQFLRGQQSQ